MNVYTTGMREHVLNTRECVHVRYVHERVTREHVGNARECVDNVRERVGNAHECVCNGCA